MNVAIIQARMSSTRRPGKVLAPILGRPMLALMLERVQRASLVDRVVVATSEGADDDAIESLCSDAGVACFRGSLEDVLDRFYRAAKSCGADNVVRLTGDCPLIDPDLVDAVIRLHVASGADYTSNVRPRSFPVGFDTEVLTMATLEDFWRKGKLPYEREHVTTYIDSHMQDYHVEVVTNETDESAVRVTVDTPDDLALVTRIFESLYPGNPGFSRADVRACLASLGQVHGS